MTIINEMTDKCKGCKNRGIYLCTNSIKECKNQSKYDNRKKKE